MVLKNKGRVATGGGGGGGSSLPGKRGVLYSIIGERGGNMRLVNLGGIGRANLMQLLIISNQAFVWWNRCGGLKGGGDDGAIVDLGLPGYSSGAVPEQPCNRGTGPAPYTELCQVTCQYNYCPQPCQCTQRGTIPPRLSPTADVPGGGKPGLGGIFHELCTAVCTINYCPEETCRRMLCQPGARNGNPMRQAGDRSAHHRNSFSKPFSMGNFDGTAALGGYGVVLEEQYFSSERCQRRNNAYDAKVPVNHNLISYEHKLEDCFYNLSVFYVEPQTETESLGRYHSTPCHMLRRNALTDGGHSNSARPSFPSSLRRHHTPLLTLFYPRTIQQPLSLAPSPHTVLLPRNHSYCKCTSIITVQRHHARPIHRPFPLHSCFSRHYPNHPPLTTTPDASAVPHPFGQHPTQPNTIHPQ
ncbi:hypothetical protein B0T14DRAFT_494057 [Immersiella caudata]|uniref:Uncharacterized protein n=1 Tax=Immersiella caudata TaxID=314043 RepID=A0AA40C2X6_9PEZI|nr:hypothetical protein B0T14DRAFT_494057 [Immersiella caudata]